jgi:hypothetical protein
MMRRNASLLSIIILPDQKATAGKYHFQILLTAAGHRIQLQKQMGSVLGRSQRRRLQLKSPVNKIEANRR